MDGAWRASEGQHHFIGNRRAAAARGESLPVTDPSSGCGREKGFEALLGFTRLKPIANRHG